MKVDAVAMQSAPFLLSAMLFCPTCANLLVISAETGYNKWACNSCAYEFPISKQVRPPCAPRCLYSQTGGAHR